MKRAVLLKCLLFILSVSYLVMLAKGEVEKINHEAKAMEAFFLIDESEEQKTAYTLWHVGSMRSYYVVLPAMYSQKEIDFSVSYDDKKYKVSINGENYSSGEQWKNIQPELIYDLKIQDRWGRTCLEKPLQILVSENLPAMMITVDTKDALYIDKKGTDRILFGSDCPWNAPSWDVGMLKTMGLTPDEEEKIFYKNAEKILGL